MSSNILQLQAVRFDTRVALGGCLLNLDGETHAVVLEKDRTRFVTPTYTVREKETGRELCTFRPVHVHLLSKTMFELAGVSRSGASGTLIGPVHEMLEPDDDDESASVTGVTW